MGDSGRVARQVDRSKLVPTVGLVLGPVAALFITLAPIPGVDVDAQLLAAILILVVVYWVTEALPLPVTALGGVALAILLGITQAGVAFAALGNEVIFLFIGSFMLARAMSVHSLDRRIAFTLLSLPLVERSPLAMMLLLGSAAAIISMLVSNTATTAMLLPVALAMGQQASFGASATGTSGRPRYTVALLFTLAYSSSIGGLATPVGTPPNLIGIALIKVTLGRDISFFEWMLVAMPVAAAILAMAFLLLIWLYRPPVLRPPERPGYFNQQLRVLGPLTPGERNTMLAFALAVVLWMMPGAIAIVAGQDFPLYQLMQDRLPEGVVALMAAILLFLLPVDWRQRRFTITWEQAVSIDWGTVLLFAGGIALGKMMLDTGLAALLGGALVQGTGLTGEKGITAAAVAGAAIVSEAASNTASANIVIPVMASIAAAAGIAGIIPAVGATIGASLGFMLPVSTPPNALIYGTGQVTVFQMVRTGLMLDLSASILLWAYLSYLAPLWFR